MLYTFECVRKRIFAEHYNSAKQKNEVKFVKVYRALVLTAKETALAYTARQIKIVAQRDHYSVSEVKRIEQRDELKRLTCYNDDDKFTRTATLKNVAELAKFLAQRMSENDAANAIAALYS